VTGRIPVFHLASLARCGQTLMLKLLAAHPRIHVPLQIVEEQDPVDTMFVRRVQEGLDSLSPGDEYARLRKLDDSTIIVVKQGVWEHRHPFRGFALVRNPYSVIASLLEFNRRHEGLRPALLARHRYAASYARLQRWATAMNPVLAELVSGARTPVEAAAIFYACRVAHLLSLGIPVFHYERFVREPQAVLSGICSVLGTEFVPAQLEAHLDYRGRGAEGHGLNDLARPVDRQSLDAWRRLPRRQRKTILELTFAVARQAGYEMTLDEVALREVRP
jgi:hypothetical protein